ncbi:RluA family pseudouridine synthase [Candidatus Chrysopegis kryptomonas]|uniref:Pseudouridine synthase n=1 Tax=Candidatus Chryseopegocella kryptomonas TaxID=1633643 RepID=A0A0P1MW00_9BACT|nr:RluA family pseudouridine synthase [Candidatus Chrysopegis kryptomonas]CUT00194.1 23S rRNA pseudouridine1911/1915/1917 synthase [Candidatus Chrysopegis kryptomonas]
MKGKQNDEIVEISGKIKILKEIEIIVPNVEKRERIDKFLTNQIENASRSKIEKLIESGLVLVNGHTVKPSHKISPGEKIIVKIPKEPRPELTPEPIPLDIVYEDEYLLVVNKPAGMVTHPGHGNYTGTLVNALLYHCSKLSKVNISGDEVRPGIVHRLDKDTSGLLVVAKDDETHRHLAKQFFHKTVEREYWAIVWGHFNSNRGVIEAELGRSKSDRTKFTVVKGGKPAITEYEVLEKFDFLSLVKLKLKTGRTHQIRVHLSHIGHPVFGDPTYGGRRIAWGGIDRKKKLFVDELLKIMPRQALHAKTLGFIHPARNEFMKFDSELPDDMKKLLEILRSKT